MKTSICVEIPAIRVNIDINEKSICTQGFRDTMYVVENDRTEELPENLQNIILNCIAKNVASEMISRIDEKINGEWKQID